MRITVEYHALIFICDNFHNNNWCGEDAWSAVHRKKRRGYMRPTEKGEKGAPEIYNMFLPIC